MNTNTSMHSVALRQLNEFQSSTAALVNSLQKLSSGKRVTNASDDSASSSMISKMQADIRSHKQTERNIQDGISIVQTADGALTTIAETVERIRELIVQAGNDTNQSIEKQYIQDEIDALIASIDDTANKTEFNGNQILANVLGQEGEKILTGLKSSWLEQAENAITNYFGLTGDGANLSIKVHNYDGVGGVQAYVSYNTDGSGKAINQELHIDVEDFAPADLPNGGTSPVYDDRIIAHELVHAVMGRTMDFASLPTWFKEGAAELIHGADERLSTVLGSYSEDEVANAIDSWSSDSLSYASGYAALRYLNQQTLGNGGVKTVMTRLQAGDTLDQAINTASSGSYADTNAFLTDFKSMGGTFILSMDLSNTDTGAIGGADASFGATKTATSVIDDTVNLTDDPLTGFTEIWPDTSNTFLLQIGIHNNSASQFDLGSYLSDSTASSLGLTGLNITSDYGDAFDKIEKALTAVSSHRAKLGGAMNALKAAHSNVENQKQNLTGSVSMIEDADFAEESAAMTRSQILVKATTAMIIQANQLRENTLQLIGAK